jgi:transcription antitermination factor NusG
LHVEDTVCPEFFVTVRDPTEFIPHEYSTYVSVKQNKDQDNLDLCSILKTGQIIRNLTVPSEQYTFGSPIRVISGPYSGCTGRFIDSNEKNECTVEVSVWGKIVKAVVSPAELQLFEHFV